MKPQPQKVNPLTIYKEGHIDGKGKCNLEEKLVNETMKVVSAY